MTGLARATALLEIGRADAARQEVLALLADDPHDVEALCLLARTHQAENGYGPMRDAAAQAVAADPEHADAHLLLAFALVGLHEPEPAQVSALEAVRLAPEDWRAQAALALAEFNRGHRLRAFRASERAVRLAPETAGPHHIRALLFDAIGWSAAAKRSYRRALAIDPENTAALTGLGRIALTGGRLPDAAGHISAVLAAAPTDHAARTVLDRLLIGALGGWGIMSLWVAGLIGPFSRQPQYAIVALALPALWVVWVIRTWRSLSPGTRSYARQLLRTDIRARARLFGIAFTAATATAMTVTGIMQDPDGPTSYALRIAIGAHLVALLASGGAALAVDRKVAGPPHPALYPTAAVPRQRADGAAPVEAPLTTDLLTEHRESSLVARWALWMVRNGALVAAVPWLLCIDPPSPWPARAIVAAVVLVLFLANAQWSRRRLIRRPGPPNALLGLMRVPLVLGAAAQLAVIVACGVLPPSLMPLPDFIGVPAFISIAGGLLLFGGWLPWVAFRAVARLFRAPAGR
ncbi:tetratricopeptide repeat protein [Dactylosporangium darangshiense]|uniref:Tetratricopeptide repeat protein n=1 Tax=Dactylosporangium darangshiense TaxID=579108 RepID=A0ABP8CWS6_9ACTN